MYDEMRFVAEFIEQGDTIGVLGHLEIRNDNRSAKAPVVHVWRVSDGQSRREQVLVDTLTGARVLGLA